MNKRQNHEFICYFTNENIFPEGLYQKLLNISRNTSLEDCVRIIQFLPDTIMNLLLNGVSLKLDEQQNQILDSHRITYHGISLHLDWLLLGNAKTSDTTKFINEEYFAKLSKATFNLAIGMNEDWLIRHYFVAPKLLWLRSQAVLCFEQLRDSGLLANLGLDNHNPTFIGKTDWRNFNKKYLDFTNPKNLHSINEIHNSIGLEYCSKSEMDLCVWTNPISYLNYLGCLKAKVDSKFEGDYYTPYQKAGASVRNLTKNSNYQWTTIDSKGNLIVTEKHINRRKGQI